MHRLWTQYCMKVRIKEHSWIARIAAYKLRSAHMALTLGHTVHLYNTTRAAFLQDKDWVCHELKHVEQFRHYGLVRFLFLYLAESARKGYYNNRWEVEARLAEQDRSILNGVVFY